MAEGSYISAEMRAAIGVEDTPVRVEVDKLQVRMFARSVGYSDPLFYDEAHAKSLGHPTLPAPPHYLGTPVFNPAAGDGRGGLRQRFETPFKRGLNGGTDIEMFATIYAGDVLSSTSRISDIVERQGSLGPMLITTTETVYKRGNEVVAISRNTGISY